MNAFTVDASISRGRREDGTARRWAMARKWVLGLSLVIACQSSLAQATYHIKPLGFLGGCTLNPPRVSGFNEAGQATGLACNAHVDAHAFLWKNDGTPMVDLGPGEVGSFSQGNGINASGQVTGYAQDSTGEYTFISSDDATAMTKIYDVLGGSFVYPSGINELGQVTGVAYTAGDSAWHAFVWKNNGSPMLDLGTLGGDTSGGSAINASGQVVGSANLAGNAATHAFIWKNDGSPMLDLGTLGSHESIAFFINASGQVAGTSLIPATSQRTHGFFWMNDGRPMQDLGTVGGAQTYPSAFNNAGQIVGYSDWRGFNKPHAFVWMNDGTPIRDLGTFGGTISNADDINSTGQVTGGAFLAGDEISHAFLWRNDGTKKQDLNNLIDPSDPLKPYIILTEGRFINDSGDILVYGTDSRTRVDNLPFLLEPMGLTLAPRSLAFGSHPTNTTTAGKSVTLSNTSAKSVAITNIMLAGFAPGQFSFTDNCGHSLTGHATCTIKVKFRPTTLGAKTAILNVDSGVDGLRSVRLRGLAT